MRSIADDKEQHYQSLKDLAHREGELVDRTQAAQIRGWALKKVLSSPEAKRVMAEFVKRSMREEGEGESSCERVINPVESLCVSVSLALTRVSKSTESMWPSSWSSLGALQV